MKTQTAFPSPAELADRTPPSRDRAIDVIRIVSLIGVVVGHTVMAISIIRKHVLICVATMVAALVAARTLAEGWRRPIRRPRARCFG